MAASSPRVTVLLPVRDGAAYLREAVGSILAQTFHDFELLVIDDGSKDRSAEIVSSYTDPRIQLRRHERNVGLIATLNEGLDHARGDYVARIDADDIAHPRRLERQVRYLDAHPEVAVLGTGVRNFGEVTNSWTLKVDPPAVRARLMFECAIPHPSAMLRMETLRRDGLRYDPAYLHAEDWGLWVALAQRSRLANLPEKLLRYRTHAGQVTRTENAEQARSIRRIFTEQLARMGVEATEPDLDLHQQIASGVFTANPEFLDRADAWLRRLADAARALPDGDATALVDEAAFRWARVCRRSRKLGLFALRRFRASPLHVAAPASTRLQVALGAAAGALAGDWAPRPHRPDRT
jgi:glycosyltransferase involved in cell wall biosynthesis